MYQIWTKYFWERDKVDEICEKIDRGKQDLNPNLFFEKKKRICRPYKKLVSDKRSLTLYRKCLFFRKKCLMNNITVQDFFKLKKK